jgi:hypothetical protein
VSPDAGASLYPISGSISVGDIVKPLSESPVRAILRKGAVTPIGHSILSNSRYEADSTALEPGDEFEVDPGGHSEGYGLVSADDRASLNVTYRVVGRLGRVNRFGGTGFDIDIPLLQRIRYDGVLQGLWATFVFITGLKVLQSARKGEEK